MHNPGLNADHPRRQAYVGDNTNIELKLTINYYGDGR